ncbi:hypothetical protein PR202_gb16038 [Eleusine coracana subsp. coracana]|uniref:Uncharacterized protein n=1 Tax=Eleusine coracana subsp. coracana TaxID=191504 RepID=A0AAV5EZV6_ELECO|nr:hypothetical protein PR202_gb16038 [Eleusine coracana subsp. coracana]
MMVKPIPESGCNFIARQSDRPKVFPMLWLITFWSALIQPFEYGSHLFQRSQSCLGETSTRSLLRASKLPATDRATTSTSLGSSRRLTSLFTTASSDSALRRLRSLMFRTNRLLLPSKEESAVMIWTERSVGGIMTSS